VCYNASFGPRFDATPLNIYVLGFIAFESRQTLFISICLHKYLKRN